MQLHTSGVIRHLPEQQTQHWSPFTNSALLTLPKTSAEPAQWGSWKTVFHLKRHLCRLHVWFWQSSDQLGPSLAPGAAAPTRGAVRTGAGVAGSAGPLGQAGPSRRVTSRAEAPKRVESRDGLEGIWGWVRFVACEKDQNRNPGNRTPWLFDTGCSIVEDLLLWSW